MIPHELQILLDGKRDGYTITPKEYAAALAACLNERNGFRSDERKVTKWCVRGLLKCEQHGKLWRIHKCEVVRLKDRYFAEVKV
jgi:hypothetical protein